MTVLSQEPPTWGFERMLVQKNSDERKVWCTTASQMYLNESLQQGWHECGSLQLTLVHYNKKSQRLLQGEAKKFSAGHPWHDKTLTGVTPIQNVITAAEQGCTAHVFKVFVNQESYKIIVADWYDTMHCNVVEQWKSQWSGKLYHCLVQCQCWECVRCLVSWTCQSQRLQLASLNILER